VKASTKHQQNGEISVLLMFSLPKRGESLLKTSAKWRNQRFADVFSAKKR